MTDNLPDNNNSGVPIVPPVQDAGAQPPPTGPVTPPPPTESFPTSQQVESIASPSPEVQKSVEAKPPPQAQGTAETPAASPVQPASQTPQNSVEHVVDKTQEAIQKETHLETTHSLTAAADEEEEDFIDHVEEVHSTE